MKSEIPQPPLFQLTKKFLLYVNTFQLRTPLFFNLIKEVIDYYF